MMAPQDDSTTLARPPRWAEATLRLLLTPEHRGNVSGDLLEQYRDTILPTQGRWRADLWYVGEAAGSVWRATWLWGVLLTASVIGREILDWWLSPTQDFYARSVVSTAIAVGIFSGAGMWTAWCSRSIRAGAVAGVVAGMIAAALITVSTLAALAVRHDPHTMRMIAVSGGLDEAILLPFVVMVPGTLFATVGGVLGNALAWATSRRPL